mmetsp:Transcript_4971/g.6747  ORF Transcript_4971/g.6747 Transcript_4971/m.6747 type:complete len:253 (-) Transcript_4971:20-778(-)
MKLSIFLALSSSAVRAFSPVGYNAHTFRPTIISSSQYKTMLKSTEDDIETAERELFEAEESKRKDEAMTGLNEREKGEFQAKKSDYDEMRARLRNRANSMDMSQSLETEQIISQAAERARLGVDSSNSLNDEGAAQLDLSKVQAGIPKPTDDSDLDPFSDDFKDFTDEERAAYDPTGELSFIEQFKVEIDGVKWPSPGTVARQFAVAIVTLAFMLWFIISLDEFIRSQYMSLGLYPKPEDTMAEIERLGLGK